MPLSQIESIASALCASPPSDFDAKCAGQLAVFRRQQVEPRQPLPHGLIGRCKGRGLRLGGVHVASGSVCVASLPEAATGTSLASFAKGRIIVAHAFHSNWKFMALVAGGLIIDEWDRQGDIAKLAAKHHIPLILGVPNAGQFIQGEHIFMLGDGRVMANGNDAASARPIYVTGDSESA